MICNYCKLINTVNEAIKHPSFTSFASVNNALSKLTLDTKTSCESHKTLDQLKYFYIDLENKMKEADLKAKTRVKNMIAKGF